MSVTLSQEGALATLRFDRSEKRNALTQAMWEALPGLITRAVEADAGVLILAGAAGGPFSAGADISEFAAGVGDENWRRANQAAIRGAMTALAETPIPTIALVEGHCVGGGCGLALCCDLIVASPSARFGITPAKLGLVYSLADTARLLQRVGPAQAKRILFGGELIDATEAERIGLVELVAEDAPACAHAVAGQWLAASKHSQRESKAMIGRILRGQTSDDEETLSLFAAAFDGADFAEGSQAFLERRAPKFR